MKTRDNLLFNWSLFFIEQGMLVRYFEDKEKPVAKANI